ncbi:hypothetical protein [Hoeflea poritis]|uniref:Lipopolysaccharide assembly protein A domain-containing protein n=1 Tax=Hoeflea poritis TaxID=2993659 RepID=A0ABT4VXP1_9HYPH|nr:hypothetical protein [Hoeflea poritis]MDA4848797.1 hypothetical protein [Hoeflea poritis]
MLRILVDFLSGIIRVLAVLCIVGGPVVGYIQSAEMDAQPWEGALIGFAAGFLIAVVVGGLLASVILVENHLRVLADAQLKKAAEPAPEEKSAEESAMERAERIASFARQYRSQMPQPATATDAQADTATTTETEAASGNGKDQAKAGTS